MKSRRVFLLIALLCWLLGSVLLIEARLGQAILPWGDPDPTTGSTALFILTLGLLVWQAGELAALRERVERLEREDLR